MTNDQGRCGGLAASDEPAGTKDGRSIALDVNSQEVVKAVGKFVEDMQKLGVRASWSMLYNATTPTYIIALERVSAEVAVRIVKGVGDDDRG